jgi:hypothetical protein
MSDLRLTFGSVALAAIQAIVRGVAAEVAVFGPRGEKKTTLALAAIIGHAQEHAGKGFPLPTTWVGAMDTFMSHTEKTMETLKGDHWQGAWSLREDKHRAVFTLNGTEFVHLWLTGVEDQGGIDRLRREMHGLWIDEAAPTSVLVRSLGLNETAWTTGISSLRLKSYRNPAILTTNYPDRSHWTWQRFVEKPHPGTAYFRIPPGENASPEERARTEKALRNRPDLLRRLHAGQPGSVQLGDPVTPGYQEMRHYDRQTSRFPRPPELYLGFDAWHHPAGVVGVLTPMGQLQIWWAHAMHNADLLQLARDLLEPWLIAHRLGDVPRVYAGDKTAFTPDQSNRQVSAGQRLLERLPGQWRATPNDPPTLIGAVRDSLGVSLSTGEPRILLCGPEVAELDAALSGGWHLDEHGKAVKVGDAGKHSHVGDAFAHLVTSIFGSPQASMDLGKWIHQPAYHQPWGGARVGETSPSPAAAVNRFPGFDAEKWRRQYR